MSTDSELYLVDTKSGDLTEVGQYTRGGMYDIALAPGGAMYGMADTGHLLVSIDPATGETMDIGRTGAIINGLTVARDGSLLGSGSNAIYAIDGSTGLATLLGRTGGAVSAEDATQAASGITYFAAYGSGDGRSQPPGAFSAIGDDPVDCLYGLSATPSGLFGATCAGELLKFDVATGAFTVIASGLPSWYGMQ